MKIESRTITIQVDADEWKKINKDWEKLIFGDKPKVDSNNFRCLREFVQSIQSVALNPSHTVDHKLNSL